MQCPYIRKAETHIQGWLQRPNDEGEMTEGVTVDEWTYDMAECPKEGCGAWRDGACHYSVGN